MDITVYQCDQSGVYLGQTTAPESPLEPDVYLIPAGAVETAPPAVPPGQCAVWSSTTESWSLQPIPTPEAPVIPTPTFAQQVAALEVAVQAWLDTTAQGNGYADMASCITYINSGVAQWAADAKAAIAWRDAVWQACYSQFTAAQGAPLPAVPTSTALIAALPQPATFGWTVHAAGV